MELQAPTAPLAAGTSRKVWVVSSWWTGAVGGNNLGKPGYSYDFLASQYLPLLEQLGEVVRVKDPRAELEQTIENVRSRGLDPIHIAFVPPQCAVLTDHAPNVIVLAWEFAEIPDHEFDGNPQNNWIAVSERLAAIVVASEFTRDALHKAGVRCPVCLVPTPVADAKFDLAPWRLAQRVALDCRAFVLPKDSARRQQVESAVEGSAPSAARVSPLRRAKHLAKRGCAKLARTILPHRLYRAGVTAMRAGLHEYRKAASLPQSSSKPGAEPVKVPLGDTHGIELSGIVYTCIFNPADFRKNWGDLLSGFVFALGDCPDATLVVKLATNDPYWVEQITERCRGLGVPYRCRIVVISQFLDDAQMTKLLQATTYYLTTTKAEGICLPLMDYLAAGRPGISPRHTALQDYFGHDVGFVVDSHPEPAAFPHDSKFRALTTWRRLVWSSLVDEIRRSYRLAKEAPAEYAALGARGREVILNWASADVVISSLKSALETASAAPTDRKLYSPLKADVVPATRTRAA